MGDVAIVFACGLVTALATGLGAVPFAFSRTVSRRTVGLSDAIASGLMLGACVGLMLEARADDPLAAVVGGALGVLFIVLGKRSLAGREVQVGDLRGAAGRRFLLVLAVMTLHSFAEGVAVGVSFGGGAELATSITVAIAVHNIPEGVAISAVMRPGGASVLACAGWSIVSSLPQPIMAVPAFVFVDAFRAVLPYGLGFAAGAMAFMVFQELLPEAYEEAPPARVGLLVGLGMGGMVLFQHYLG